MVQKLVVHIFFFWQLRYHETWPLAFGHLKNNHNGHMYILVQLVDEKQ